MCGLEATYCKPEKDKKMETSTYGKRKCHLCPILDSGVKGGPTGNHAFAGFPSGLPH